MPPLSTFSMNSATAIYNALSVATSSATQLQACVADLTANHATAEAATVQGYLDQANAIKTGLSDMYASWTDAVTQNP